MRRTKYYINLYSNPYIRLKWFLPLIKKIATTKKAYSLTDAITIRGMDYYFKLSVRGYMDGGIIYLTLIWEDQGSEYNQKIRVLEERSNLIPGSSVYFFLCPYGFKSKVLFYIGNLFQSRRAFKHHYHSQNQSKRQRINGYFSVDSPIKPYGKVYYKGRLTPYGKRCLRYEEQQEQATGGLLKVLQGIVRNNKYN